MGERTSFNLRCSVGNRCWAIVYWVGNSHHSIRPDTLGELYAQVVSLNLTWSVYLSVNALLHRDTHVIIHLWFLIPSIVIRCPGSTVKRARTMATDVSLDVSTKEPARTSCLSRNSIPWRIVQKLACEIGPELFTVVRRLIPRCIFDRVSGLDDTTRSDILPTSIVYRTQPIPQTSIGSAAYPPPEPNYKDQESIVAKSIGIPPVRHRGDFHIFQTTVLFCLYA